MRHNFQIQTVQGHSGETSCSGCCLHPGALDFPEVHVKERASEIDWNVECITFVVIVAQFTASLRLFCCSSLPTQPQPKLYGAHIPSCHERLDREPQKPQQSLMFDSPPSTHTNTHTHTHTHTHTPLP